MGASGSIFGLIGCLVLDLIQNWRLVVRPCWELSKLSLMIVVSFAFGLLPFLDNFGKEGEKTTDCQDRYGETYDVLIPFVLIFCCSSYWRFHWRALDGTRLFASRLLFKEGQVHQGGPADHCLSSDCPCACSSHHQFLQGQQYLQLVQIPQVRKKCNLYSFFFRVLEEANSHIISSLPPISCLPINGWCDAFDQSKPPAS